MHYKSDIQGFTLVELITVMVIIAIISSVATSRMMPNSTLQLQAGRDLLVTSLFTAQQQAMSRTRSVRLMTTATTIDIRIDENQDSTFSTGESITSSGTTYPITLSGGVVSTAVTIDYNRLGHTTASTITLSKSSSNVSVTISGTGYAY